MSTPVVPVKNVDQIDEYLNEIEAEPNSPVQRIPHGILEDNFALEAWYAISTLQNSIGHLNGVRDYCKETAHIRYRLKADNNDPDELAHRINSHISRLEVELRALSALFFGTRLG